MRTAIIPAAMIMLAGNCSHQPASGLYPVVSPESGLLITNHFANNAHIERTLSRAATGDTTEHESVVTRIDEVVGAAGANPTIVRVSTGHYAGGDYYDSLVVRRTDLRPIREHMRYVQRRLDKRFEYEGGTVHQTNSIADSATSFDRKYDLPVFAFSEVELLVRSLPYRAGFTSIVPLYSEGDDAIEMDSISVVSAGPEQWTIRFADPAIIATYGLDVATRRILSYDVVSRKTGGRARKSYEKVQSRH